MRLRIRHCVTCVVVFLFAAGLAAAQSAVRARIRGPIDDGALVRLRGNTHPLAQARFDQGAAPDDLPARRMILLLSRSSEQQSALNDFLAEQQTPGSPNFMHWLTPAEFGQKFGPADADIAAITGWLRQQGFNVDRISAGKTAIEFSGTAGEVQQAFHTAIHQYAVEGGQYWANVQDPSIPAALATVVRGVVSLNNFPRKPLSRRLGTFERQPDGTVKPQFTTQYGYGTFYAVAPTDFATIYNITPLLQGGNNGAGQTIAVIGRSNVNLQDISNFRSVFGVGAGDVSVEIDGTDPGFVDGDEGESDLDLEWSGAAAPGAKVMLVSAQDTETTSGLDLAALRVIDDNVAGVMSLSYGACESSLGTAGNQYIQSLWRQASAQGITVVVSSGDSGSAGCDYPADVHVAKSGLAVNGLASTPYNVAVGGTDFNDAYSQSTYWNSTIDPTTRASAKSYIPEITWNASCAATSTAGNLNVCPAMPTSGTPPSSLNVLAGAGGASNCTVSTSSGGTVQCQSGAPKPSWQSGPGVPADGVRDVPDISLFGAVNTRSLSFYVQCQSDAGGSCTPGLPNVSFVATGGTSASAATFAGIVALAEQKAGTRLGNLNYLLYNLAAQAGSSCASAVSGAAGCMFHDVTSGNISVPCAAGSPNCSASSSTNTGVLVNSSLAPAFSATTGYDLATGLGSVNVANLVNGIATAVKNATPTTVSLTLNGATAPLTATHGDSISIGVSVSPSASSGTVSVVGNSGGIGSHDLSSGTATWSSQLFSGGTYSVRAHYAGDATHAASDSNAIPVTINPEASQTLVNLISFDAKGLPQSYTASSVDYGSPYVLRTDVTDAAGAVSSSAGVSSTCSKGIASCPTGRITLTANGSPLDGGSFPLNSKGYFDDQLIQLPAGSYSIAATYPGDASYKASSGSVSVTVAKAKTTLIAGTAVVGSIQYGSPTQVDAQLATNSSGVAPTGTYTFFEDGAASANVIQSYTDAHAGSATTSARVVDDAYYVPAALGTHSLYATYSGDSNYLGSDSSAAPFTVNVGKANVYANSWGAQPNIALPTVPVTLTVYFGTSSVKDEPTGTVTFYDNGSAVSGTVTYGGHAGSGLGSALLTAQLTTTFPTGQHAFTATYSGDDKYNGRTQTLGTVNIYDHLPTSANLTPELNPTVVNYATTLTVRVGSSTTWSAAPPISGTVTFSDNGTPLSGTVTYKNQGNMLTAALTVPFTTTGTHSITAVYSGDSTYATTSSAPLSLNVTSKIATSILFYPTGGAVNRPVSLTASVQTNNVYAGPIMGGAVTFSDNGTPLTGNVQLTPYQGLLGASLTYTFTTAGTHNITAQYSGDTNYAASQSKPAAWDILGPLAVRLQNSSVTMASSGGTGTQYLSLINTTSAAMPVTLACTTTSPSASCSVSSSSINLPANTTNMGVTITYTVPRLGAAMRHHDPFTLPFVLAGVLAGMPFTKRRKRALLALAVIALLVIMVACGGGGSATSGSSSGSGANTGTNPPPSQSYQFTVTATSGSNTDSQVLTVTVQ